MARLLARPGPSGNGILGPGDGDDNSSTREIAVIPDDESDEEESEANPQPAARTRLDPGSLPEPSGA